MGRPLSLVLPLLAAAIAFVPLHAAEPDAAATPASGAAPTATESPAEGAGPPPAPAGDVRAEDTPNDPGGSISIRWSLSPDDRPGGEGVSGYEILRAGAPDGPWESIGMAAAGLTRYRDPAVKDGTALWYRVDAIRTGGARTLSAPVGPAIASPQWFNGDRLVVLVVTVALFTAILVFIVRGRRGRRPFVRRIAGLDALDESIGRATEMGRPILYIPGTHEMNDAQTVASMTILAHVARKAAAYDTPLKVPCKYALVMETARETVREACLAAGRPDAYREENFWYVSEDQFGYVAGAAGTIVRDRPATCIYVGAFFAEALVLAETGYGIGAIQIAGTAQPAQLPFFVAACDYTLIGEELFAASAYLSGEPHLLGSLRGQDIGKLIAIGFILLGTAAVTAAGLTGSAPLAAFADGLRDLFLVQ